MIPRDPTDERLRERTSASFIASLIIHALVALLFFSVLTSSSEQSSPESTEGAPSLSISRVQLKARTKSAPPVARPPQTNAPRTGPPKARPVLAGHPPVPHHRELAKQNPKAPPNPTPAPIAHFSPNPQPSQVAVAMPTPAPIPEVPQRVPNVPPVAMKQTLATPRPTAAPATPAPSPKPTAQPQQAATAKPVPASPAPSAAPTAQPTKAPAVASTAAPTSAPTAAARTIANATPAPKPSAAAGIASPAPSGAPSPSVQRGNAPSPGPKALAPAGQTPVKAKPQPARPIQLPPTPTPAPPLPRPKPAKTAAPKPQPNLNDLRNRLLANLPKAPINPSQGHYNGTSSIAKPGDPLPPPEILAKTKYIYESGNVAKAFRLLGGREQRVKMYVTEIKRHGAFATCTGWLVRFPMGSAPAFGQLGSDGKLNTGYPGRGGANSYEPVIEEHVTFECEASRLQPYTPSAAPSPGP